MKKQTRSFLVEVKRPRLATPNAAVQRIIWPELRREAPAKPLAQLLAFSEGLPAAAQEERRVLPDLSPTRMWHEPDEIELEAKVPSPSPPKSPSHNGRDNSRYEAARPEAAAVSEEPEPKAVHPRRRKLTPWLQRSLKDSPPGHRWKRRLPRCTW